MPRFARFRERRANGQMLVIFAISIVVMILFAGLIVDGGSAFLNRRDSQNSSDIAAIAGTKRLADYYVKAAAFTPGTLAASGNNVFTSIEKRMQENGCTVAANCTWTARYVGPRTGSTFVDLGPVGAANTAPPGAVSGQKALGVKVDVTRMPPTFFLGVIGQSTWTIQTTATAVTGQPSGAPANQLLPIGLVSPPTMDEGSIYPLTSGSNGPGNFGWISWDGSNNAGALAVSLCTPNNPAFVLPTEFPGDPGKTNASAVRACLEQWRSTGTTVLIPIVEPNNGGDPNNGCATGGQGDGFGYCIIGIAAFVITGYAQPAVDVIEGRFIGTMPYSTGSTVPGGVTAPPVPGSQFYYLGLAR